jgi:hypothetical protein
MQSKDKYYLILSTIILFYSVHHNIKIVSITHSLVPSLDAFDLVGVAALAVRLGQSVDWVDFLKGVFLVLPADVEQLVSQIGRAQFSWHLLHPSALVLLELQHHHLDVRL